nr:hypothetical protein [Tanacetum cinerariifolium]
MMVQAQKETGEGSATPIDPHHTPTIIQPSTSQPQKTKQHRKTRRKVTKVPQPSDLTKHVVDEAVNKEIDDSLEMTPTTDTSLDAKHDRGNIFKTQSKATPNESGSQGTSLGGGPRCQETMGDTIAQTKSERLQQRVLDLETTKATQALEIDSLKRKVKKLKRRKRSSTHRLKRLYKVGLSARVESSEDKGLDMFGVNDLNGDEVIIKDAEKLFDVADDLRGEEVFVSQEVPLKEVNVVSATTTTPIIDYITLAKALMKIKSARPKADKVMIQESEHSTTTTTSAATTLTAASTRPKAKWLVIHEQEQEPTPIVSSQQPSQVKDKGKGKMVEPEPMKKLSKKDQLMLDEELAFKLQAKEEEEEEEERLQAEEQEELTDAENAKLFMQFLEKRRKFFAAKRAKEKRNKPPTRAQQRSIMCTYLKNMEGWKPKSLKNKSFDNIQELFDKAMKRVNTFVDYRTELALESSKKAEEKVTEGSSKRVGGELEQENVKKQNIEDDNESVELK